MTATAEHRIDADTPHPRDEHLIHVIPRIPRRAEIGLLIAAVILGGIVRGSHILASDFPLNDGGRCYAFAADLQHSGFRLPGVTDGKYSDKLAKARLPLIDTGLVVSGRVSYEIMQKAIAAGIPLVAAIGAPSSLAIDLAEQFGVTLIGFLRAGSMNLYSGTL